MLIIEYIHAIIFIVKKCLFIWIQHVPSKNWIASRPTAYISVIITWINRNNLPSITFNYNQKWCRLVMGVALIITHCFCNKFFVTHEIEVCIESTLYLHVQTKHINSAARAGEWAFVDVIVLSNVAYNSLELDWLIYTICMINDCICTETHWIILKRASCNTYKFSKPLYICIYIYIFDLISVMALRLFSYWNNDSNSIIFIITNHFFH